MSWHYKSIKNYFLLEYCSSSNQYKHIQEALKIFRSIVVIMAYT
ncbi:hypothetical protein CLOAM1156 [Candidatus Cloacimonas acidaminovorans str. Evry]|uniref:Uncharacterized protein n=1 Tax=Cloacimonas acidaminovorans (strain Evry) TaxID=459349 RepID=B0VI47_CLOAI|nr:hypothetical protein CLOAM1156 [Candidatus Cloacimonas acidaminovorans str. Evry]